MDYSTGYLFIAVMAFCFIAALVREIRKPRRPRDIPVPPPRILAWYELAGNQIAIRPYTSRDLAAADANRAAAFSWSVQSVTTNDGHVNVGHTVTGAVLTSGISVLANWSRTQGNVTVTFVHQSTPVAV